jgi:hypothetical protein
MYLIYFCVFWIIKMFENEFLWLKTPKFFYALRSLETGEADEELFE